MKGSYLAVESLLKQDVDTIFGITGGAIIPFYDALYDYKDRIREILVRHEQGAAHAAEGYARASGKTGVCSATSGPGSTNLVTGIADAFMDSVPMVAIGGQVATKFIGNDAFQESDLIGITTPITKHNFQIRQTEKIPEVFAKAFKIASTGRPGPVYIDFPKDIQQKEADVPIIRDVTIPGYKLPGDPDISLLRKAAEMILKAERPLIVAGGGAIIADAAEGVYTLAETLQCPIATTTMGKGIFPETHPLSLGVIGMHGQEHANYAVINTDLLVAIGCRFSDRVTGDTASFQESKKIIHIDIDPAEMNKNVRTVLPIVADAKKAVIGLSNAVVALGSKHSHKESEWLKRLKDLREHVESHHERDIKKEGLTQAYCVRTLSKYIKDNDIVTTGVGQHQMFGEHYLIRTKPRTWITSGGAGTMGFGLPAAMGAKVARPDVEVFDLDGDGSFQMTSQELATVREQELKINPVIMNNSYLGMVRQWLEEFQDKRYSGVYFKHNPDFVKLAEAYHLSGITVTRKSEYEDALRQAITSNHTTIVNVMVEQEEGIWPMLPPSSSLREIIRGNVVFKQSWKEVLAQRKK